MDVYRHNGRILGDNGVLRNCCCGIPDCLGCRGRTPLTLPIRMANFRNNGCDGCDFFNATFILDFVPDDDPLSISCRYQKSGDSPCGPYLIDVVFGTSAVHPISAGLLIDGVPIGWVMTSPEADVDNRCNLYWNLYNTTLVDVPCNIFDDFGNWVASFEINPTDIQLLQSFDSSFTFAFDRVP
jgi:hypothetical protein